jgi:hypothetical protein
MKPTDLDIAILRAFKYGDYKRSTLMRAHPELGDVGKNLDRLYGQCYLNREVPSANEGAIYTLAAKGARLLNRLDREEPEGQIAPPREIDVMRAPAWTGSTFTPPRAGSMKAFELPSLQGNERVERKRPIIVGAKPEPHYRSLP